MTITNDPSAKSWIDVPVASDFPIQNLPFGIFKTSDIEPRAGMAIGNQIVDLVKFHEEGFFHSIDLPLSKYFNNLYLNDFIALGKEVTNAVRQKVASYLKKDCPDLRDNDTARKAIFVPMDKAEMLLPIKVGDYTDFYSSEEHARNVGTMFRDPENALLPNWKHLPVGYHGRASSIIPSGVPIHRPKGQTKETEQEQPSFGPTKQLDFELEMAFITCNSTKLGDSISTAEAEDHIFGFVLFNDWSARDIQKWEYVPLGPFLGKSFASSISPWIVTIEALEAFRTAGPEQNPSVLPYLKYNGRKNYDVNLEVAIKSEGSEEKVICRSNFKNMYWNINQQLAHQTVNGCNINVGDMYASGTISGAAPDSFGSMLELAWKGTKPVKMPDGSERKFINDGDTVIMRGYSKKNELRIGFGEVSTKVLPALEI